VAYLLQILVVVISLRIKLGASKQITRLALYTMISPKQKKQFQYLKTVKLKICRGRKTQLVVLNPVLNQVVTNACCGLAVIFCGFISLLIGRETRKHSRNFLWFHGFRGMTEIQKPLRLYQLLNIC